MHKPRHWNIRALPLPHASFTIFSDDVRRMCSCSICHHRIIKGERRMVVMYGTGRTIKPKKGGQIFTMRQYFHMACFHNYFDEPNLWAKKPKIICLDCKEEVLTRLHPAYPNQRGIWAYICDPCRKSPRWRECKFCDYSVPRFQASPILEEGIPDGHFVCDRCADEWAIMTIKNRKRLRNMSEQERDAWTRDHDQFRATRQPF